MTVKHTALLIPEDALGEHSSVGLLWREFVSSHFTSQYHGVIDIIGPRLLPTSPHEKVNANKKCKLKLALILDNISLSVGKG